MLSLVSEEVVAKKAIEQVVRISQALLERLSIPQVAQKKKLLSEVLTQPYWNKVNVQSLEHLRNELRDLIQYITDEVEIYSTDFKDDLIDQGNKEVNISDFKTYEEKVIDYLLSNEINETIVKIKMLDKITPNDLKELERILWQDLGTKDDYFKVTKEENLAVFIRSIVGIEQEAINQKFSEYLNTNILTSKQQEFVKSIISYVQQNGDISKQDLVDKTPFSDYDVVGLFDNKIDVLLNVISELHESIVVN
jgi:type I restriction enzyme R subunit